MKVARTALGVVVEENGMRYALDGYAWDDLFREQQVEEALARRIKSLKPLDFVPAPLAPIVSQEVWAAGVTYYRSRDARMEESKAAGGGDFYSRVYEAERPELFFKSAAHRVAGPGEKVRIRKDSKWNVPEPELTLAINASGEIFGCTIGNDMSSRDIEGENPLYLPQAKVYDQAAALGPCILLGSDAPPKTTAIAIRISRDGKVAFEGSTTLAQLKRDPKELAGFLFRDMSFPHGAFLMTGTGIVPPNEFTLNSGDVIAIEISSIGTLENVVG
jgi:2-dehydro-3-deoxy-D-arabinonate dehydratase